MKNTLITIKEHHITKLMTFSLVIKLLYFLPGPRDTVNHISGIVFDMKRYPKSINEKKVAANCSYKLLHIFWASQSMRYNYFYSLICTP